MGTIEYIEANTMPEPNTGCWLWLLAVDKDGYGLGKFGGRKMRRAPRAVFEALRGPTTGFQVLHRCDTPGCVNPDHLFLGTNQDNVNDKVRKGRQRVGIGDRHGSKTQPWSRARGDRHGSKTKPWSVPRGDQHYRRRHAVGAPNGLR